MTRTFLQTDEAVRIQHDARTVCPQSVFKVWESWICPACGLPILRDIPDRIRDVSFFATVFGKYTRKGSREELGQENRTIGIPADIFSQPPPRKGLRGGF